MTSMQEHIVDDAGMDQAEARQMLKGLCDNGFEGDMEKASLVLGRPAGELQEHLDGSAPIDDDLAMKIKGIAHERNISLD